MFSVYIIHSENLDRFYIGFTSVSLTERLRKHNSNHKGFTGRASDWKVVYYEVFESKSGALKRERAIKAKKSRDYIESLISSVGLDHPDL